jgi:DNA-damage-inducible protein D
MDPTERGQAPGETIAVALIEEQAEARIRRIWHEGRWFFSVIDVVGVLTDAPKPRMYWADMKRYVQGEGFTEVLERIQQLKLRAADGKLRETDAADTETLLRIIQSIPSPKAEPVK